MADVKVPIRFEIYKGDNLVREEVLAQDVIKVGKLASSHLRLDDETVSRMHAVIEVTGPDEIHIIDLGSTRGTLVNGERISKARLQSGDEIMFGDSRVAVTFLDAAQAQMTPPPQAAAPRVGQKTSMGIAPEARTIMSWATNFVAGRFTNAARGYNPIYGTPYILYIQEPPNGAYFTTWREAFNASFGPLPDARGCGRSPLRRKSPCPGPVMNGR